MSKFQTFCKEIILLSKSNNLDEAINEWKFIDAFKEECNCICGQHIMNVCIIRNEINDNSTNVGNVCVKKFMSKNKKLVNEMEIGTYNKKALERKKLYKKCICGNKIKLKDLGEHSWKLKCLKCYLNKK
tara:strand:+ start:161 stop:547 length:387 start_codon:yes stop_codon:yes gene_type:complete